MPADAPTPVDPLDQEFNGLVAELEQVRQHRYYTARGCGLSVKESQMFADSDGDIEMLRRLHETGCPMRYLRRIIL